MIFHSFCHSFLPSGDSTPPPSHFPSTSDLIPQERTISRTSTDNLSRLSPPIKDRLMLEVYTQASLSSASGAIASDEHGGSDRLAALGERVFGAAVMTNLFRRLPMYSTNQLRVSHLSTVVVISGSSDPCGAQVLSNHYVDSWRTGCKLMGKPPGTPGVATETKGTDVSHLQGPVLLRC